MTEKTTGARDTNVTIKLQKELQVREILTYNQITEKDYKCARY